MRAEVAQLNGTMAALTASPMRTVRGAVRRSLRQGRTFRQMLAEMEARERWSADRLRAYQEARLRQVLATCSRHVPYYVDLFRRQGLDPGRLSPWEMLERIPPLDKSEVRQDPERFRNQAMHGWLLHKAYTSGTTGTPLICWRDLEAINFENAMIWRQRRWAGFGFGDRLVTLRGDLPAPTSRMSAPYWRYDSAERQLVMSSYHLGPRTALDYAAARRGILPRGGGRLSELSWHYWRGRCARLASSSFRSGRFSLRRKRSWILSGRL